MNSKQKTSQCGEFCRSLCRHISESGYTVYKISQITGLGRSAIQHTMSGKLLPAKEFVEKLCSALPITPYQRDELMELYLRDKIGEEAYHSRKEIIRIIESLSQYHLTDSPVGYYAESMNTGSETTKAVTGIINVNNCLREMFLRGMASGGAKVTTTIPFENTLFYNMALHMLSSGQSPSVFEHYIRIYKNDSGIHSNSNISTLESALKMSMNSGISYLPFYHYAYREAADDFLPALPYMLITEDSAAMLSADFNSAVISSDPKIRELLLRQISIIKSHSRLMIDIVGEKRMFDIFAENSPMYRASVEFQPCLTKFLNFDIISRHIIDFPYKDDILRNVSETFFSPEAAAKTAKQIFKNFFTRDGLDNFADTGRMMNMPGELLSALDHDERIAILRGMRENIGSYVMIDRNKINVPPFMQIIMLTNKNIIISCLTDNKKFCCILSEPGLCSAFEDFICSLDDSAVAFDDDILCKAIDECIDRINEKRGNKT